MNKKQQAEMTEQQKVEFVYNWIDERFNKERREILIFSELPGRMRYSIVPNPFATERAKQTTPTPPAEGNKPKQ